MINGKHVEDPSLISEAFKNFFINIGNELDKKIPQTPTITTQYIPKRYNINIELKPTTESEIGKIIQKLKLCSTGWDNIPAILLKENCNTFKPVITHIVNSSLEMGVFPKEMKIANVVPIFKAGGMDEITNYRPVSILTTISKIYEKIFYSRLITFLKEQKILFKDQFGFRENNSTYMAIINLLDRIIEALDGGGWP